MGMECASNNKIFLMLRKILCLYFKKRCAFLLCLCTKQFFKKPLPGKLQYSLILVFLYQWLKRTADNSKHYLLKYKFIRKLFITLYEIVANSKLCNIVQSMDLNSAYSVYIVHIVLGIICFVLYKYVTSYNHWSSKGIPGPRPLPFLGTIGSVLLGGPTYTDYLRKVYTQYENEPVVGIYNMSIPILIIRDVDLIKDILINNFDNFADRAINFNADVKSITEHLFNIDSVHWKYFRTKFNIMYMENDLQKLMNKDNVIECQEVALKCTACVIGSYIFGINAHTMVNEQALITKVGRMVFEPSFGGYLKKFILSYMPIPFKYFKLHRLNSDFFLNIIKEIVEFKKHRYEKENGDKICYDFIDILLEVQGEDKNMRLTSKEVAAQVFTFFLAGTCTTASTISYALYELAQAPQIQERLRNEITNTLVECNNQITYEALMNMTYLNMVIQEVLRKYPSLSEILRQTTKPCMLGNTGIQLHVNQRIVIPVYAIHYDPQYYPRPELFDPERFSEENKKTRPHMVFLPFGKGPRNCIGKQFGQIQSKFGLITILKNYYVSVCEKTEIPLKTSRTSLSILAVNGIHLKFEKVIN
ncbi:putative cytochrome P450 6a13 [Calliopsis andreniformis]|uniref:putative cytochrome P450 6a13 n=1 Tax=Calliopsis andreniformis TaxID=337506 RepID=UPI003FCD521F